MIFVANITFISVKNAFLVVYFSVSGTYMAYNVKLMMVFKRLILLTLQATFSIKP